MTGTHYCAMCNIDTQDEWMVRCTPLRVFEWSSISGLCFLSGNVCVIGKVCAHLKCGTGWDFTAVTRGRLCAQVALIVKAPDMKLPQQVSSLIVDIPLCRLEIIPSLINHPIVGYTGVVTVTQHGERVFTICFTWWKSYEKLYFIISQTYI